MPSTRRYKNNPFWSHRTFTTAVLQVPLSKSEVHLSSMLDTICKKMDDYARAKYKSNGKLTLVKMVSDGGMNPMLGEVDFVQDGDLNKSLEYFVSLQYWWIILNF